MRIDIHVKSNLARYGGEFVAGAISLIVAFAAPAEAATEKLLYSFGGAAGGSPDTPLVSIHGKLYGATWSGGLGDCPSACGTVFSFDPKTGIETVLHAFGGSSDDGSGGAGLIDAGGKLYGTTWAGGTGGCSDNGAGPGCGTVFSLNLDGTGEKVVRSFQGSPLDGQNGTANPTYVNSLLYGTTTVGGDNNAGTVFSVNLDGSHEKVLHSFGGSSDDGAFISSSLVKVKGRLYGTTADGGTNTDGTVFSINPDGTNYKLLHTFGDGTDGRVSTSSLIDVDGILYGTTQSGGTDRAHCAAGCGTVYSIDPKTGAEKVIYSFTAGSDGELPTYAGVTYLDGKLYGVTVFGGTGIGCSGAGGCGTIFSVGLNGKEKVIYSFKNPSDGQKPEASLTNVNGTLYGTTFGGGANGGGALFSITP